MVRWSEYMRCAVTINTAHSSISMICIEKTISWLIFGLSVGIGTFLPYLHKSCSDEIPKYAIIVHGGAYAIPDSIFDASEIGCRNTWNMLYYVMVGQLLML